MVGCVMSLVQTRQTNGELWLRSSQTGIGQRCTLSATRLRTELMIVHSTTDRIYADELMPLQIRVERYSKENVRPAIETTQNHPRRDDHRRCEQQQQQQYRCASSTTIASNSQTIVPITHAVESGTLKSRGIISCPGTISDAQSAATTAGHIVWAAG